MLRFDFFRIMVITLLMILVIGLFRIQVLKGSEYYHKSENNRIRLIELLAPRGNVYDRNGVSLIQNRPSYNVTILPQDFNKKDLPQLAELLDISEEDIKAKIKKAKRVPFMPAVLKRDVEPKLLFILEEMKPELGGIYIQVEAVRHYPFKNIAAHVLGYVGRVSKSELDNDDEGIYHRNDLIGRAGIEKGLDTTLRGSNGGKQIEVDSRGRLSQVISERKPKKGKDVYLGLDIALQSKVENILDKSTGTIGLIDLKTGEVITWVNHPSYDPNSFVDPHRSDERMKYLKDKTFPMIDRGLKSLYPPGSVFKMVTILAAFQKGKLTNKTTFHCSGQFKLNPRSRPFKCWYSLGHGPVNIYKSLEQSCNVFLYNLGRMLTPEEISQTARKLGIGQPMDIELDYKKGIVPDSEWKRKRLKEKWYLGETISYSIGQGFLSVTPMEVLKMISSIAVEDKLISPHFTRSYKQFRPRSLAIDKRDLQAVKKGLYRVVQSDYGTGQYARVDFAKVAGKTGTAQSPQGEDHAWFSGFFPYKDPEIAFVIFVEHGKSGGGVAARLAKKVILAWKEVQDAQKLKETQAKEIVAKQINPVPTPLASVPHAA